jgi:uncharacterized damage-inducible protein DinB
VSDITSDLKSTLQRYLRKERDALLASLDGLDERQIRWPLTPSGTNLLGLVKHTASVSLGYFGETFDRDHGQQLPWFAEDARVNDDMWATADQTRAQIVALHEASARAADATIEALDLDSPGRVPWWPEEMNPVTLHQILVHMVNETARHAGHADVLREGLDGQMGRRPGDPNAADGYDWPAHVARVQAAGDAGAADEGAAR